MPLLLPTAPNTFSVAQAIQAIMQSATVGGSPAYSQVLIGGLKDYTDLLPVGVIIATRGSVERYTLGRSAKIREKPQFAISSAVNYDVAATAETAIFAIRDAVTFLFAQSLQLGLSGGGVVLNSMVAGSERYDFATINGQKVRYHEFLLEVTYEYTLPLGPQP